MAIAVHNVLGYNIDKWMGIACQRALVVGKGYWRMGILGRGGGGECEGGPSASYSVCTVQARSNLPAGSRMGGYCMGRQLWRISGLAAEQLLTSK